MRRRQLSCEAPTTLAALVEEGLCAELGTQTHAEQRIRAGSVYVRGRRVLDPDAPLRQGDVVLVVLEEGGQDVLAHEGVAPFPLRILYEDTELIAVDKPAGLPTQPTPGGRGGSLLEQVSGKVHREVGLVHRLDRDTSGVVVFGKRPQATSALAAAFREGTAHKGYLAVAAGTLPEEGSIDLPLSKDPSRVGRFRATRAANGVPALTLFRRLHQGQGFALVSLEPRTGRTHQLRAHLAALGAPIVGDGRYGGPSQLAGLPASRCLLHAQRLELPHPSTGEPLLLWAEVPEDLAAFFQKALLPLPTLG